MTASQGPIARLTNSGWLLLVARLYVAGIFGYLAFMKLRDVPQFVKVLCDYGFFEHMHGWANYASVALPWLEILCAVALLLGLWRRAAAATIIAMLLFFYPLLIHRALVDLHDPAKHFKVFCDVCFDCGCGTGVTCICRKLAENTSLLLAAFIVLVSRSSRWTLDGLWAARRIKN